MGVPRVRVQDVDVQHRVDEEERHDSQDDDGAHDHAARTLGGGQQRRRSTQQQVHEDRDRTEGVCQMRGRQSNVAGVALVDDDVEVGAGADRDDRGQVGPPGVLVVRRRQPVVQDAQQPRDDTQVE